MKIMKKFLLITLGIMGTLLIAGFAVIVLGLIPMTAASGFTRHVEVGPQVEIEMLPDAEQTTREFYDWYLESFDDRAAGDFHNPLAEKTYQESSLLTGDFKSRVDDLLQSFEQGGYDPFLCAQDIPDSVSIETQEQSAEAATVRVQTSFEGHQFEASLIFDDQSWKIDDILCETK